jgi:type IV pilus assembly protein PilY1
MSRCLTKPGRGQVLWEWNNPDSDVTVGQKLIPGGTPGFTYGRPVIVKVRDSAYPFGSWVAIVTGGYNNLSGRGKVFFLDAKTGVLLSTVTTPADPGGRPMELAQTHAFVKNQNNQTAEQIYGGDLLGNVWRIDVSATDSYKAAPAVLFAQLTDPGGAGQPVTTAPQIEIDFNNGIDRYVFVGTVACSIRTT